jgi:serine/threonine protein phosphatase PrpC
VSPRFVVGGRSDVGLHRRNNQDSMYAGARLIAVADGVGGAAGGEVASRLTISALISLDTDPVTDPSTALNAAADKADTSIRNAVARDSALNGMGTTLTAILATDDSLTLAHIGDSRAYLLRDGELTQLTHDHTLVQSLIDDGQITEQEALTHPRRSWILRALDGRGNPELDLITLTTQPGDRYLVCSDGLSSYVDEADIGPALGGDDPQQAAARLIDLALRAGGPDNITCAIGDLVEATPDGQEPILAGAIAEAGPADLGDDNDTAEAAPTSALAAPTRAQPAATAPAADTARPKRRSIGKRLAAVTGIVVVLVVAAVIGWISWIHHQWYVAPSNGNVAIYRGVHGSALGHDLSSVRDRSTIPVTALPQPYRGAVEGRINEANHTAASQKVASLRQVACPAPTPTPTPTLTPTPTTTAKRHPNATTGITATPTPSPTPLWCASSP